MNVPERDDLLAAWGALRPGRWLGLAAAAAALDEPLGRASWTACVPAEPAARLLELRASVPRAGAAAAARVLGLAGAPASAEELRLVWNGRADAVEELTLAGAARGPRRTLVRLRPGAAPEELEERAGPFAGARFASEKSAAEFRALDRLCPVAAVEVEFARSGEPSGRWRLILRAPEPWPRFLRLDAAVPFGPDAAALTLALTGLSVAALGWRGEAAWAELAA
ncbi:MAG: hypothetical protein KGM24_01995 [Elusimicrobia bacterium]|nr:hypothetical protein [Elusimicrobiota bacterium]